MTTGIPFTKGSGRLINESPDRAGINKCDTFITNVVHCHPPKNLKSYPDEADNCKQYLSDELKLVGPKLVIGLGKHAKATMLPEYRNVKPLSR